MITHYPSYYKDFKCIASKCKTSCCSAGWEICIDKNTADFYKSVSGKFGDRLRNNIDFGKQSKFKLKPDGRCPFLNENNLCDIYINLGSDHLCQICSEHPRFYECFNNLIECGLGIYCEEVCRIILSQDKPLTLYDEKTDENFNLDYNEDVFNFLYKNRFKIFDYLANDTIRLNQRIADVIWYANILQQDIDSDMLDDEDIFSITSTTSSTIEPLFKYLLKLEQNDEKWFDYLNHNLEVYTNNIDKFEQFEKENQDISKYLQNLAIYYIYRYFLRGIYDEDILSRVKFMAINIAILKTLFFCKWIENNYNLSLMDCVMITKKYSEEIECNDDNVINLHIACYEIDAFSTENLIGLFI